MEMVGIGFAVGSGYVGGNVYGETYINMNGRVGLLSLRVRYVYTHVCDMVRLPVCKDQT